MEVNGHIHFKLLSQTEDETVAEMPVEPGILNPYGVVNAGAILWFADANASVLVMGTKQFEVGMKGFPLAINLNANLMGNAADGTFYATSNYVKKGRSVIVVRTVVKDQNDKLIADITTSHVISK